MSDARPAAVRRRAEGTAAASDWTWPPSKADLDAIARIDVSPEVYPEQPRFDEGAFKTAATQLGSAATQFDWPPTSDDVERIAVIPLASAPPISAATPTTTPRVRRRALLAMSAAAVAVLAIGIVSRLPNPGPGPATPPQARPVEVTSPRRPAAPAMSPPSSSSLPVQSSSPLQQQVAAGTLSTARDDRELGVRFDAPPARDAVPEGTPVVVPSPTATPEPIAPREANVPVAPRWPRAATADLTGAPAGAMSSLAMVVPAAPAPVEGATTVSAAVLDEASIRDVLQQYRTAYSQLDPVAARAIWPSVDTRVLGRAFDSLRSQQVRFATCDITVNGSDADAACTGTATWVPRVGDPSPRMDRREWTFRLQKTAQAGWRIRGVQTR